MSFWCLESCENPLICYHIIQFRWLVQIFHTGIVHFFFFFFTKYACIYIWDGRVITFRLVWRLWAREQTNHAGEGVAWCCNVASQTWETNSGKNIKNQQTPWTLSFLFVYSNELGFSGLAPKISSYKHVEWFITFYDDIKALIESKD